MQNKSQSISKRLTKLQETTFINEVFNISSVDEIATISGFRLGRTQRVDVPQDEINAALGQVVYLLCVQAHHLGYVFDSHFLHACGAFSKISTVENPTVKYELFLPSSEDRFNKALQMLLFTLQRFLQNHVIQYRRLLEDKKEVQLYPIEGDKINKSSIKYSGDNLEQWTRACKCLLTQL